MSDRRHDEILKVAFELQAKDAATREASREEQARFEAAGELGLDRQWIEKAESVVREREIATREAEDRARGQRRLWQFGAGAVALLSVAVVIPIAAFFALRPAPPAPFVDPVAPAGWTLVANPGTEAALAWEADAGRSDVAVLRVERFAPKPDGTYSANLDSVPLASPIGELSTLSFDVRGDGLPVIRVYLEAQGERWRSPALPVTGDWQRQTVPLSAFEHQIHDASGGWKVTSWSEPDAQKVSFKVGHYMNDASASGEVRIDELRIE